jgi:trans-aconitate methyltransferase
MEATTKPITKWNANLYDDKHSFVFKFGEDLVDVLNPKAGERILDLGCGTGVLSNLIAESGASVVGIDSSADMINKAKTEYSNIDFQILSATDFYFEKPFDAIFSNAVLHWVLDKESAIDCMYKNLKPGGRLVLEMGGKNNVSSIINAIKKVLIKYEFEENAKTQIWYYPSLSEYSTLLENKGFRVTYASHYDRETELKDKENGIKDWLKMFCNSYFKNIDPATLDNILNEIQSALKPVLFINDKWIADYKRLRVVAIKN